MLQENLKLNLSYVLIFSLFLMLPQAAKYLGLNTVTVYLLKQKLIFFASRRIIWLLIIKVQNSGRKYINFYLRQECDVSTQ